MSKTTKESDLTSSNVTVVQDEREKEAQRIIQKYSAISISAGFVPVPFLDLATLAGIQLKAIQEIGKLYGHEFKENLGKSAVTTALTTLAANPVAKIGASLLRIIPVVGPMVANVSFHGYAAASTYALGNLFNKHFANGGTILDFDAKKAKQAYKELVAKFKSSEATVTA